MSDEIFTHRINHSSRNDRFTLHIISDTHIGNRAVLEHRIRDLVKSIQLDDNALVIFLGDMIDCITIQDSKRFEAHDLAKWIMVEDLDNLAMVEADRFIDMFEPIKDKVICYVSGNHESELSRRTNQNIAGYIATKLGIDHLGDAGAAVRIVFERAAEGKAGSKAAYNGYLLHGYGGARTKGAKENKVSGLLAANPDVDFACIGHDHSRLFDEVYQPFYGKDKLWWRHRVAVMCGAFISNPRYGRRNGYPASFPGSVQLTFHPESHGIGVRMED